MKVTLSNKELSSILSKRLPVAPHWILERLQDIRDPDTIRLERFTVDKWNEEIEDYVNSFNEKGR